MADAGLLEYTFQVEFKMKSNVTEIRMFQEFVWKVTNAGSSTKFLPWSGDEADLPDLDHKHKPYANIKGKVKIKHYLGGYNRHRGRIYGRVKVQLKLNFIGIKDNIVDWLRQDLHWIKEDYIQARWVSNIGLLGGTYNVVDLKRTSKALENVVAQEIQQEVKLDLKLRKVRCKNDRGNSMMVYFFSVSVDARQVSKAVQ